MIIGFLFLCLVPHPRQSCSLRFCCNASLVHNSESGLWQVVGISYIIPLSYLIAFRLVCLKFNVPAGFSDLREMSLAVALQMLPFPRLRLLWEVRSLRLHLFSHLFLFVS